MQVSVSSSADSRTCETLPGEELTEETDSVWMESTTTISGLLSSIVSRICSASVAEVSSTRSPVTPSRFARSLICRRLSSPETYSTRRSPCSVRHICSSTVDLPMPGSPQTKIAAPGTIPPPSTRSNSSIPVWYRTDSSASTQSSAITGEGSLLTAGRPFFSFPMILVSSVRVFQFPQSGHRPCHLALS